MVGVINGYGSQLNFVLYIFLVLTLNPDGERILIQYGCARKVLVIDPDIVFCRAGIVGVCVMDKFIFRCGLPGRRRRWNQAFTRMSAVDGKNDAIRIDVYINVRVTDLKKR